MHHAILQSQQCSDLPPDPRLTAAVERLSELEKRQLTHLLALSEIEVRLFGPRPSCPDGTSCDAPIPARSGHLHAIHDSIDAIEMLNTKISASLSRIHGAL